VQIKVVSIYAVNTYAESAGIAIRLNLGASWIWVVKTTARQRYLRCSLKTRLGGPQNRFGLIEEEKHFFALMYECTWSKNIWRSKSSATLVWNLGFASPCIIIFSTESTLSFKYSSTCLGYPHALHQELDSCSSSLWFTSELGDSNAVDCGWAGWPDHYQQHCYHHAPKVKPEAATAVVELLMMGVRTPETCWTENKYQAVNRRNCCIWLVIYLNCMIMHGPKNLKKISTFFFYHQFHKERFWEISATVKSISFIALSLT